MEILKKWWNQVAQIDSKNINNTEQNFEKAHFKVSSVTELLINKKVFIDDSTACNYIHKVLAEKGKDPVKYLTFSDFLTLFLKGIMKEVVSRIA